CGWYVSPAAAAAFLAATARNDACSASALVHVSATSGAAASVASASRRVMSAMRVPPGAVLRVGSRMVGGSRRRYAARRGRSMRGWAAGGEAAPAASVERRRCRAAPGTHVVLDTGVPGKADSLRLFSNGRLRPASQRRAVLPASIAPVPGPTDAGRRDGIFSFHRHGRRRGGAHGTPIPSVVV